MDCPALSGEAFLNVGVCGNEGEAAAEATAAARRPAAAAIDVAEEKMDPGFGEIDFGGDEGPDHVSLHCMFWRGKKQKGKEGD